MFSILEDFVVVAIPTKTNFRGINLREAALFRGEFGWSEFSPFLEYGARESATWLKAAIEAATQPWPEARRTSIPVNATLPRVAPARVAEILNNFPGSTTIKIKIDNFESDRELITEAHRIQPESKIRLDVNGGWNLTQALSNISALLSTFGEIFDYIEQPCLELADLAEIRRQFPIKIAVDESIRKNLSGNLSALQESADVAIIKWAPSGGFASAKKLIDLIGLPAVISSALDTGIGISHGLALAASLPELDYACGLGTTSLFISDICSPPVAVSGGAIEVRRVEPDMELIAKYRAPEDRQVWWRNRVKEIAELGEISE